jgi:DNA-binding transcriptional LysR family regulator
MILRHLKLFLAVGGLRSFSKAAQICHLSQPAVTEAIRKLEHGLGANGCPKSVAFGAAS